MTPQDRVKAFLELAPVVYGRYWKSAASANLNVSPNTIRNWRLGNTAPDEATIKLLEIYAQEKKERQQRKERDARKQLPTLQY